MKLEAGMYVRYIPTQGEYTQKISKITKMENRILDMGYQLDNEKDLVFSCHFDQIINASHNIIDLIEVGDYVNELPVTGYYTRYDEEKDDYIKIGIVTLEDYWEGTFTSYEYIKSIVTKEMFSSISYKVGE